MRSIVLILVATLALTGCAAIAGLAELGEAGIGVEAAAGATGGSFAAADFSVSSELFEETGTRLGSATREASLSQALYELTDGGQRPGQLNMNGQGAIMARGQSLATLEPTGDLVTQGRKIGFMNATDGLLYETLSDGSARPIGVLRGFVRDNGVELLSQTDRTVVRILRSDVVLDIIGIEDGQYRVRLGGGETGLVPSSAVQTIAILALAQALSDCPSDDRQGAVVRQSGEVVSFTHCERKDGAYILSTDSGDTIIDDQDVQYVLTGDGVPGVQDDAAKARLIAEAQNTAAVVNSSPGQQAMNILATTTYLPVLEEARLDYRAGRVPEATRQQMLAQQAPPRMEERRQEQTFDRGQRQVFLTQRYQSRPQFLGTPRPWQQPAQQRMPFPATQPGFTVPHVPMFQPRPTVQRMVERPR